jgi:hydrogenase maturation protein HypF
MRERHAARWQSILAMGRSGVAAPRTSSVGRLFDAVAALLGVRDEISYEGQAAIELEQLADVNETAAYTASRTDSAAGFEVHGADLVRAAVIDVPKGVPAPIIAARFHNGVADAIVAGCRAVRERTGLDTAALSGGVFQNVLLLERTIERLEGQRFRVLRHRQVPPNDGGISLGQAVVANQRVARGSTAEVRS